MENKLGALWKNVHKNGDEFFTGVLENADNTKTKIVIFKNGYKNKDSQPDYMILKAREKQDNFEFNTDENEFDDLPF